MTTEPPVIALCKRCRWSRLVRGIWFCSHVTAMCDDNPDAYSTCWFMRLPGEMCGHRAGYFEPKLGEQA